MRKRHTWELLRYRLMRAQKLIGVIEDILSCLQRLETSGAEKKHFNHKPFAYSREQTFVKPPALPDVSAKPFVPSVSQKQDNRQGVFPVNQKLPLPTAPPLDRKQNNASQSIRTDNAQVCFYHQTFGDKVCMCNELSFYKLIGQRKVPLGYCTSKTKEINANI